MQSYPTLAQYLKDTFNRKIIKLPIDGGFSCPNREEGNKGCLFCSDAGSGEFTYAKFSIEEQLLKQKQDYLNSNKHKTYMKKHNVLPKYIAYFQSFTNTYASIDILKSKYDSALLDSDIVGLDIATRPDCLDNEVIELLSEYNKKTHLWVELGFQTSNEQTATLINRGYRNEVFSNAVMRLQEEGIKVVSHIIFGLPNENYNDYFRTANYIKQNNVWGIKFHSLYIQKNSFLQDYYNNNPFSIITKDEYTDVVAECIKIFENKIIIHRLTGDCDKKLLFEPVWSADKLSVISSINRKLSQKSPRTYV